MNPRTCRVICLLDLHGSRSAVVLVEARPADIDRGGVVVRTGGVSHVVDERHPREVAVLVDRVRRCLIVAVVREHVLHLRRVRLAERFSNEERRIEDRANGPLVEGRLVRGRRYRLSMLARYTYVYQQTPILPVKGCNKEVVSTVSSVNSLNTRTLYETF